MTPRAVLAIAALSLAPIGAAAEELQGGATADITGSWSIATEVYGSGCKLTGEIELRATDDPDILEGRLVAHESCEDRSYEAEQVAIARRDGERLVVESAVMKVTPRPLPPVSYWPDNFVLTIVDGALMVGELRSAHAAPATFRRRAALIG